MDGDDGRHGKAAAQRRWNIEYGRSGQSTGSYRPLSEALAAIQYPAA